MKKLIRNIVIVVFLAGAPFMIQAQTPPHINGGGTSGSSNSPLGGSLIILLALGIGYSAQRIFDSRSRFEI